MMDVNETHESMDTSTPLLEVTDGSAQTLIMSCMYDVARQGSLCM